MLGSLSLRLFYRRVVILMKGSKAEWEAALAIMTEAYQRAITAALEVGDESYVDSASGRLLEVEDNMIVAQESGATPQEWLGFRATTVKKYGIDAWLLEQANQPLTLFGPGDRPDIPWKAVGIGASVILLALWWKYKK